MQFALLSHDATTRIRSSFDTKTPPVGSSSPLDAVHSPLDHSHLLAVIVILLVAFGARSSGRYVGRLVRTSDPFGKAGAIREVPAFGTGLLERYPLMTAGSRFPDLDAAHGLACYRWGGRIEVLVMLAICGQRKWSRLRRKVENTSCVVSLTTQRLTESRRRCYRSKFPLLSRLSVYNSGLSDR